MARGNAHKTKAQAAPKRQLELLAPAPEAPKVPKPAKAKAASAVEAPTPPAAEAEGAPSRKPKRKATAEQMAQGQREISISEFFTKNRHLLGFDSASKALLTAVKEAVDNSLDACEEAGILPDLTVEVQELAADRFRIAIEDNGPGIVKAQVPKVFGKLLYGSKFHRLKQSRGQQGIGISAAVMYGQLTTGKPALVTSKTGKGRPGHRFEIQIDTRKNAPVVVSDAEVELPKEHGTRVEIEMTANYLHGQRSLLRYLEQTALANPHASLTYLRPAKSGEAVEPIVFPRASDLPPKEAVEIKPHPQGVELGALMLLLGESKSRELRTFLHTEFSRVSTATAEEICQRAKLTPSMRPHALDRVQAEALHKAIGETRLMAPPLNCLSPIGDELMRKGLINFLSVTESPGDDEGEPSAEPPAAPAEQGKQEEGVTAGEELIKGHAFFISTVTRPPKVYRGNPFQVEVGLAYGGNWPQDRPVELYRFANRVPLLFQRGACGMTEAVVKTDWRNYLLSQPKGALPVGPMVLLVHIASVWVPFTSESKEAVAHYPEILKEIQLASQECGRKLAAHIRKRQHQDYEAKRRSIFELYIEEVVQSLGKITGKAEAPIKKHFLVLARRFTGDEDEDADGRPAPPASPPSGDEGEED